MGEIVDLKGQPLHLEDNAEFVCDLARFADGVLDEKFIRMKYRLAESAWEALGSNEALVEKIELEKVRRISDGSTKREKAQRLITAAPDIMSKILLDDTQSARHRIDSAKALDSFASNGPDATPAGARFVIQINLGADLEGNPIIEKYDKSVAIDVNDGEVPAIQSPVKSEPGGPGEGWSAAQQAALESLMEKG